MTRRLFLGLCINLVGLLFLAKLTASKAQQFNASGIPQVAGPSVRARVYHELTTTPQGVHRDCPLISGDGTAVVHVALDNPNRVLVTSFGGTVTRELAAFSDRPKLDIYFDGTTWSNVSNPTDYFKDAHPGHHALAVNPQNPTVIWLGCSRNDE